MILLRELTDGNRLLMGRTDRQQEALGITRTPELTLEVRAFRLLTEAEAQPRHIIRTREPMLRPDRDRARTLSGAARTCREGTRALPWATTTLPRMERWQVPRVRREEKWPLLARSGETAQWAKLPAAICTPGTMVTFTKTQVMVGRSTITEAGIP
jgi:hypothetical protein